MRNFLDKTDNLSAMRLGIILSDANRKVVFANNYILELTGYSLDELIGHSCAIFQGPETNAEEVQRMRVAINSGNNYQGELLNYRKNGSVFWNELDITPIANSKGEIVQYFSVQRDITNKKQLENLAYYDNLTELPNRLLLIDRIGQAMTYVKRNKTILAVLFLDFDGFKAINDRHGHDAGDAFLVGISHAMSAVLRESDTLARLGGDEFVILLTEINQIADIAIPLRKLLQACNTAIPFNQHQLKASASIGCSLFSCDMGDQLLNAKSLLHRADQAMYVAKRSGKNRYHIFDEASDKEVNTRDQLLVDMQAGLVRDEFMLDYQPKVNMRSGALIGVEGLIRWNHPVHGQLQPEDFLPLIEEHYLNIELGEWVVSNALAQLHDWQAQGLRIAISINIHANHLTQSGFVESLQKILAQYPHYSFGSLELEILESCVINNSADVRRIMLNCQAMGIAFALDDFGTGYSSLNAIKQLPARTIKIDRSFIARIDSNFHNIAILEGLYHIATKLGHELVVEGIETIQQGEKLIEMGYEQAQGFAIAKPMPPEQIPDWLNTWTPPKSWLGS
jgi:diguanylate cyclase (GGDEF)-like protein/PAS domain S-box-containing protein